MGLKLKFIQSLGTRVNTLANFNLHNILVLVDVDIH